MMSPHPGDRIRLIAMPDDPAPIPPNATGTVTSVRRHGVGPDAWLQLEVEWDNGRKLMLSAPPDQIEILPSKSEK